MASRRLAGLALRAAGVTLILLGLVHLAATPHIPQLLDGMSERARQFAVGPTLLNHVLVGILLLPLGFTTWVAAARRYQGEPWAGRILAANAITLLTLPITIVIFMRQPEYYHAPLFVLGVTLVALTAVLVAIAAWARTRPERREIN